jgi:hypothetical protein
MLDRRKLHLRASLLASILATAYAGPAEGALHSVSGVPAPSGEVLPGGPKANVAYSLSNGFPLWYQDANGLKLELCLDQRVERAAGVFFFPCITAELFTGAPISFPSNFGPEAFWWSASAFGTFTSTVGGVAVSPPTSALLVLAQEAAFTNGLTVDGAQAAFGRIRIRISVPAPGTYRVRHPYGEVDYVVGDVLAVERGINQTQDVGNLLGPGGAPPAGDFTLALADGPDPANAVLPPGFPAVNATPQGVVSNPGVPVGLGPFLVPADPTERITALNGATYLSDPGTDIAPRTVPVTNPVDPTANVFSVELLSSPTPDVVLCTLPGPGVTCENGGLRAVVDRFQVTGKVFNAGPNQPPVALPDAAGTARDRPVQIDVVANDLDPVTGQNVHGISRQAPALGLPTNPANLQETILLTAPITTQGGGKAQRFTDFTTGRTTFVYTPAAGFVGVDTFQYVVQDRGGLISAPATVTVTVEEVGVARADYRVRAGSWRIHGTSSDPTDNAVVLLGGPRAHLSGASEVPAVASNGTGGATLRLTEDAIEYGLTVDGIPAAEITAAHIHVGQPGTDGPVIFSLYDSRADGAFAGAMTGTLTESNRVFGAAQTQAGVSTFADALAAILAGNAYVNVRTAANAAGELRGQLVSPVIGTAPVDPATGRWSFPGKSRASPGAAPASVNVVSANGVRVLGTPLRMR